MVVNAHGLPFGNPLDSTRATADKVRKKTKTEEKDVRVVFTAHGFIYKRETIPTGEMRYVQVLSRNVWISPWLVVTILLV